jgi:dTDP-4-dehydrorhamnose reductase
VAHAVWALTRLSDAQGIFHWTDAGVATWFDFAVAIAEEGTSQGLLDSAVSVTPIRSHDYPQAAVRPSYSVLDTRSTAKTLSLNQIHWRDRLREMMRTMALV